MGKTEIRYQKEADFIRAHAPRLREIFLQEEFTERALKWDVDETRYRHIVDDVTRLTPRDFERSLKRYAAARVTVTKDGPLEVKRQLMLHIQLYANGTLALEE
jgi:hypothetical protein